MNPFEFVFVALLSMLFGAFLGQVIRKYRASIKLRAQQVKKEAEAAENYIHERINLVQVDISGMYTHFHERVKSTESSIDANTRLLESHAKQLAGDVKSDVKAAGKKI